MDSIHKATLIGTIVISILIAIVSISLYAISCKRQIEMANAGFEQVQTIGHSDYVWQKINK
jgi:hypothetical protein